MGNLPECQRAQEAEMNLFAAILISFLCYGAMFGPNLDGHPVGRTLLVIFFGLCALLCWVFVAADIARIFWKDSEQ